MRPCATGRWRAFVLAVPLAACLVPLATAPQAQGVVDVLQRQRRSARLAEIVEALGERTPPRPAVELETEVPDRAVVAFHRVQRRRQQARDSLVAAEEARADSLILAAQLATLRWDKVEPGAQGAFLEQYREAYWQAAQPQRGLAIDSLDTHTIRGLLQAAYGRPTRNADAQQRFGYGGSEYIQFEYWFVVNDSIPVLALDIDGPFGTGLLIASDEAHADLLRPLKAALSAQLEDERPDPWVDYYHAYERRAWFRTGYNGAEAFTVEVRAPRWSGRPGSDRWIIHR